jgi:hypothetical protein
MVANKKQRNQQEPIQVDLDFALVVAAFAKEPGVHCGQMFSSKSVLSVNGKIFAMLTRGKFVAKLPRQRVEEMVSAGKGEPFDPGHGRLMKEWISMSAGKAEWVELAREACEFVRKGKPRRR